MKKLYLILSVVLLFCVQIQAEKTTAGKEFWVGFFGSVHKDSIPTAYPEFELYILVSSQNNCSGTITNPNTGYSQPFTVTGGLVEKVLIPFDECYHRSEGDTLYTSTKGLLVTTSDSVSLFAGTYRENSSESTLVLPISSLGTHYKIANYPASASSSFLVLATEDNTEISFVLNDTIWDENTTQISYLPNIVYQKTLNRGETMLANGYNLIGSTVKSNCKPIAIFAGDYGTKVPSTCTGENLLMEQIHPIHTWGKSFLVNTIISRPDDSKIVIISKYDNTSIAVKRDGVTQTYVINANEYKEIDASQNGLFIESDKAIAVTQYAIGEGCSFFGNPFMLWITPIEQQVKEISFTSSPNINNGSHYIQIFTLTANKNQVFLDGVNIGDFNACSQNPLYSYAQKNITPAFPPATHTLTSNLGVMAYLYYYGLESHAYAVGSSSDNLEDVVRIASFNGVGENLSYETNSTDNIYNPWDTITINRDVQSDYTSISWCINGTALVVPEENNQPQLTVNLPACRLLDGENSLGMILSRSCGNDTIFSALWLRKASFSLLSPDQLICEGDSVQLFASTSIPVPQFVWFTKDETLTNQSSNPFVAPQNSTKYFVYAAFDTYHTDMDSLMVSVKPKSYHTINESICPSEAYNFNGTTVTTAGIYYDTQVNSVGCDSIITLNLTYYPQETILLTDSIYDGESIVFGGKTLTVEGVYADSLTNIWNCDSVMVLDLFVIKRIQPPTVFTPNGDGVNDRFIIKDIDKFPTNSIKLFNRWGNLVFEASPYQNNWNGYQQSATTADSAELPVGTYFYILDLGDGSAVKKGFVYLNR